jgi:hypothetical protein
MLTTPLHPYYKLRVNVRPIKHAYFIREEDFETLNKVVRSACTQWGGIRNLIIPVKPDITIDPIFEKALKLHEPDEFVSYVEPLNTAGHKDHNALRDYIAALWPYRGISIQHGEVFDGQYGGGDQSAHALGVLPDEYARHAKQVVHKCLGSPSDHWILHALFGAIYPRQEKVYAKMLELEEREICVPSNSSDCSINNPDHIATFWAEQFNNSTYSSVLNLTSHGIAPYRGSSGFETLGFNVVLIDSMNSLCSYWNVRATNEATQFRPKMGRRVLLLPEAFLDSRVALESMIAFIRANLRQPNFQTNRHINFNVWDGGKVPHLKLILRTLEGLEESTDTSFYEGWTFGGGDPNEMLDRYEGALIYSVNPPYYAEKGFVGTYYEGVRSQIGLNVELQYGNNEILYEPPQGFRNRFRQCTILDIVGDVWDRYPRDQGIATDIRQSSWFTRYGLSFVTTTSEENAHIPINLPDEWTTLDLFFKPRGYDVSLSVAGRYGNALIDLAGGLPEVGTLATKATYNLLNSLTFRSTKKIVQQILKQSELPEELVRTLQPSLEERLQPIIDELDISPELKRITKTFTELSSNLNLKKPEKEALLDLISDLSARQIIKRGFNLKCERCGTPSWYPLQIAQETVTCLGCSYQYPFPVKRVQGQEIQWEYTLNTLVNRLMDQDVLPHVLALYHLAKNKEISCAVPGLLLQRVDEGRGKHITDLDFVFISKQEIYAGECKSGTELGGKDFETAKLAAGLGIQHFYFCTVKAFSERTQQQIEELKAELKVNEGTMSVDTLSGAELIGEVLV